MLADAGDDGDVLRRVGGVQKAQAAPGPAVGGRLKDVAAGGGERKPNRWLEAAERRRAVQFEQITAGGGCNTETRL